MAYGTTFTIRDVAKCSDGYIVVGYKYAVKINDNSIVWTKNHRNGFYLVHSVAQLPLILKYR
ncbi:hypothetical protein [Archaeoglobus sp.]